MAKTKPQLIVVAVLVCLFAIGMAGLLNFFKYRSNAERIMKERLVVTGTSIENSIQSSLALGLQFCRPGHAAGHAGTGARHRPPDPVDRSLRHRRQAAVQHRPAACHAPRPARPGWPRRGRPMATTGSSRDGTESAAGIAIQNSFGLAIGYLALPLFRSSRSADSTKAVARQLALVGLRRLPRGRGNIGVAGACSR